MALFENPGQREEQVLTEKFLTIADKSIKETIEMFFEYPSGFHGDTGLQHYLYHAILTNAGEAIYLSDSGVKTLLFQCEVPTQMTYQGEHAQNPSRGDFDLAFITPPIGLRSSGRLTASIAFELGRNKAKDKIMGDYEAPKEKKNPRPGDAAKIIRDLRFASLKVGYLLEFFDSKHQNAPTIAKKIQHYCDETGETRCHIALALLDAEGEPKIWLYPPKWGDGLCLKYEQLDIDRPLLHSGRGLCNYEDFLSKCGDGGRALQQSIHAEYGARLKLVYGPNTMTVNLSAKQRLVRIGNKCYRYGECLEITDSHDQLFVHLFRQHLKNAVTEGSVRIPDKIDGDFTTSILKVISEYLQQQNLDT